MRIPSYILTQPQEDGRSLLYHVFGALQSASDPVGNSPSPVAPEHQPRRGAREFEAFPRQGGGVAPSPGHHGPPKAVLSPAVMVDFDPNIHVDNTKEGYLSNNASPLKSAKSRENIAGDERVLPTR